MDTHIKYLLNYCQDKPELYNKVATKLWVQFGIRSAELSLLCTYMIAETKPQTGHWIKDTDNNRRWDRVRFYCSECGNWQTYGKTNYCPECGAKMEDPQERSVKE